MEMITEMEENTHLKKLVTGGIRERKGNKMTREEKDDIALNLTIMRQDILDRGELPPKEYIDRK